MINCNAAGITWQNDGIKAVILLSWAFHIQIDFISINCGLMRILIQENSVMQLLQHQEIMTAEVPIWHDVKKQSCLLSNATAAISSCSSQAS